MNSKIKIIIENDALEQLPGFINNFAGAVLLVADQNTHEAAGRRVAAILNLHGVKYREFVFQRKKALIPDEQALAEIRAELIPEIGLLIAIGSGTITDLVRFVSFQAGKPFITVPTAPSMDGYASPVAALTLKGFKQTLPAAPPLAVFAAVSILEKAPPLMIKAGLGDLLGKYTALADWWLGHIIAHEEYSPPIANLVRSNVDQAVQSFENNYPPDLRIKNLTKALIVSGEAMLQWGNSRPASGAEHHLAHFWEMQAALKGKPGHLHGIKVGIATIIVTGLYHNLFKLSGTDLNSLISINRMEPEFEFFKRINKAYGVLADSVLYDLKGFYRNPQYRSERQKQILDQWENLRKWVIENIPSPVRIKTILRIIDAPSSTGEIGVNEDELTIALESAKEVRRRYTVFRLAEDIGLPVPVCRFYE